MIQNPGYYYVAFHGSISPISGSDFPLTVTLYLEQNGNIVQGTPAHYTFQTSSDTGNVSFSQIVQTNRISDYVKGLSERAAIICIRMCRCQFINWEKHKIRR